MEDKVRVAISQLKNSEAHGEDGVTAEILRLGGELVVQWLNHLADCVWREEAVPKDWKKSLLIRYTRKASELSVITTAIYHCSVFQAWLSAEPSFAVSSCAELQLPGGCLMGGLEDHVTIIVNGPHYQHKKTTAMAVLPHGNTDGELYPNPESITLHPNSDPIEAMSSFEYLGSTMSDDCILLAEVEARISKTSRAFRLLNRVLWYQRKIKQQRSVCSILS